MVTARCAIVLLLATHASGFAIVQPPVASMSARHCGQIFCSAPHDKGSQDRALVALQSGGLTRREMRRIELGMLPTETMPEERLGLCAVLLVAVCLSSIGLVSGAMVPAEVVSPWDVPLFGCFVVSMCALLQVAISPSCLDGQGAFGRRVRGLGWHAHALAVRLGSLTVSQVTRLSNQPRVRGARVQLGRLLDGTRRRSGAHLSLLRARLASWAVGCGLAGRWSRCREWWQGTPVGRELAQLRGHLVWNWRTFLAETEARETREWMADQLGVLVQERRRAEGETR